MKLRIKAFLLVSVFSVGLLTIAFSDDQEVFLESKESKTIDGKPIFNRIKWFKFKDKDVWMMNQSHFGVNGLGPESWDRLAIVIDKTQSPKTAKFYQFESGPLEWKEGMSEKSFKVSCFMCHNNGPRAIRPNYDSLLVQSSFNYKLRISLWNLRIKLYGRVLPHASHDEGKSSLGKPFRYSSTYENEPLKVKACMVCHKESGLLARGLLSRQQTPSIEFMLESGEMPPLGFSVSPEDRAQIKKFLDGF